ncbi:hypothetical protein DdX_21403 [Ditylenchus destructor]|uniref:Uncharacterized protein n=1 Tax=Ditylenchus destructor TaxID=166010 RepID=A0AAD4MJP4_9BILA|nr:hypothetical protein DdX_21403 [Ditylenchus destructor]
MKWVSDAYITYNAICGLLKHMFDFDISSELLESVPGIVVLLIVIVFLGASLLYCKRNKRNGNGNANSCDEIENSDGPEEEAVLFINRPSFRV